MPPGSFHPAVAEWFAARFDRPAACQAEAWPAIAAGSHTLIAAPTGSGKTLAAFLAAIDALVREAQRAPLPEETRVVYVSPLKALGNDVRRNLEEPLQGVEAALARRGLRAAGIRTMVRSGDTPAAAREAMRRRPPHIVVTTPESLYLLLTSEGGRGMLRSVRTVIVDEIHALAGNRRGAHLALSLERLAALAGVEPLRIGLSATQKPVAEVARYLTGTGGRDDAGAPPCTIVDHGHARRADLALELPASPLEAVMPGEVWAELYDRLATLIEAHRTTLVFVNTRRMAERVARHLAERLGEEAVLSHHGSLAKETRLAAEQRLKAGELRALVATASLELGIDIGPVDLVCQLGSTRRLATFLQRAGRAGHRLGGTPRARLFPLSRDDLVECAALLDALRRGELDRLQVPAHPLDVLAQQIVAMVACETWEESALFARLRRAWPYRGLPRREFDQVVRMLAEGFSTRRGRRGAHLHRDAVNRRLRPRRGARLTALTCGGAIPDSADYDVVLEPEGTLLGTLNEDFAIESLPGQIFQLGNSSWRILRIEAGRVRVADARGQPPDIPFWFGEAPPRSEELSAAVSRLREGVEAQLAAAGGVPAAARWLERELALPPPAALQIAEYLGAAHAMLGALPTLGRLVLERFFDESGGMQLIVHSPAGGRLNRALGLALRKRFCRRFNFELQAAATEDAIVLSLGESHSFPLEEVSGYLHSASAREVLTQALLDAPVFTVRWRWNATIALAVPRRRGGRRVPPQLQRMRAEDLVAAVFPDQLACVENLAGAREIPDHPLVGQTLRDCLREATDADGLEALLGRLERGEVRVVARDLPEPSPLAHEILGARPYAFLDDAPLEERRTQAVLSRRWMDPAEAAGHGRLDEAAIERVRGEAWPEVSDAEELHDALLLLGFLTAREGRAGGWQGWLEALGRQGRAALLEAPGAGGARLWVAAERCAVLRALYPGARLEPPLQPPAELAGGTWTREAALDEVLRGRLEGLGPVTAAGLAGHGGLPRAEVEASLLRLEAAGVVLRGRFSAGAAATEWCERRLLARIHRYTVTRLRQEIEPVSARDFLRFLLAWQHVAADARVAGPEALAAVAAQLEGFAAPAAAWEGDLLPARVADYDPQWLDDLGLSGRLGWARPTPPAEGRAGAVRTTPIALLGRAGLGDWLAPAAGAAGPAPGGAAQRVLGHLQAQGASFFDDIVAATGLLRSQTEAALGELVARGLAGADSFRGLRALLLPAARRGGRGGRHRQRRAAAGLEAAGRWSLLPRPADAPAPAPGGAREERIARSLLRRYGVVFRRLLERESGLPPWRELLRALRRLEARGEIRGGRFVAGFSGEQFALPEAVPRLRAIRRAPRRGELVSVGAADPLNLVGILTPGPRVPALSANRVLYRDGVPVATATAGEVHFLVPPEPAREWDTRNALLRRSAGGVESAAARRDN